VCLAQGRTQDQCPVLQRLGLMPARYVEAAVIANEVIKLDN
jgi:hypothetical protein